MLVCPTLRVAVFIGNKPFTDTLSVDEEFREGLERFLLICEKHGYEHVSTTKKANYSEYTLINS